MTKAASTRAYSVCRQKREKCMLTDSPLMSAVKPLKSLLTTLGKDSRHNLWLGMYAVARHTILNKTDVKSQQIIFVIKKEKKLYCIGKPFEYLSVKC